MSDLDFDELDRAVNSLITKTPTVDKLIQDDIVPVVDDNKPVTQVSDDKPSESLFKSLAGQRSSGRFMDVIHPSSDMRTSIVKPESTKPSVTPVLPSKPVSVSKPSPEPIITDDSKGSEPIEPKIETENEDDISSSLESPFIAGAKVEKRPLGAFSDEAKLPTVELSATGEVTEKYEDRSEESSEAGLETPLPEELQEDLLKIESGSSNQVEDKKEADVPEFEKKLDEQPVSIIQQYKVKSDSNNEKTGPIYDTNVYHKSPEPEEKKKSGWLWIVWILLLLLVGVGAGAAAYFVVLPLL